MRDFLNDADLSDAELAEKMLASKPTKKKTKEEIAKQNKQEIEQWYKSEFLPYKQAVAQNEKQSAEEFSEIVRRNPQEIKYILSCLFENKNKEAVVTWNDLRLKPRLLNIEIKDENLILTDVEDDAHEIHFDTLLDKIDMVLGG